MSVSGAAAGSQIRRHHTISITPNRATGSSRTGVISEEPQEGQEGSDWHEDDDDFVAEDWTAPAIGSVGDGSKGLHRQASLPTAYHNREVHRVRSAAHMATRMNSLSAIEAEHVGEGGQEEDDWEKEMPWNRDEGSDTQQLGSSNVARIHPSSSVSSLNGPNSPIYTPPQAQSPPPATGGANVRRHQSLTYGPATGGASKLSRTLTATANKRGGGPAQNAAPGVLALGVPTPDPREASPEVHEEDDEGSVPSSPVARAIGWGDRRSSSSNQQHGRPTGNDWRESTIDDVQRAIGALEMQSSNSNHSIGSRGPSGSISSIGRPMGSPSASTPPRYMQSPNLSGPPRSASQHGSYFPPSSYMSPTAATVSQRATGGAVGGYARRASSPGVAPGSGIPLADRREAAANAGGGYSNPGGPPSRSNSMPTWDIPSSVGRPRGDSAASGGSIGFASLNNNNTGGSSGAQSSNHSQQSNPNSAFSPYSGAYVNNSVPGTYDPNTTSSAIMMPGSPYGGVVGLAAANGPMDMYGNTYGGVYGGLAPQSQTSQQQQQQLSMATPRPAHIQMTTSNSQLSGGGLPTPGPLDSPEIKAIMAAKGYNPHTIDTQPKNARFFVIKSYTEEDVHKSLKYEIWSSTDPGNKRLDKAFRENAGRGPIYLFFSVNTSGHFCGMAEMLTPLDYSRTSTVWAQDKWKGVFKVRWIFVKDIPNAILRGIRLENTQERKPVTNSRDTQELLPDAGNEMVRIFLTQEVKTSLLQDLAYYDVLAMQKANAAASSSPDAPTQAHVPGPPQRLIQQRQQQQHYQHQNQNQHQQQQQVPPQGLPRLASGTNDMYAVTPQQYQLLQQSQYSLASTRNMQEQLAQQQQLQMQQQQQSLPAGRLGGDIAQQYANMNPSGMPQPQPQPPQRPPTHRQGSGSGRTYY